VQAKIHISPLFVSLEKTLSYKNARQVGFDAEQVDFQVTCPAGGVAVGTIFEAWLPYIFRYYWVVNKSIDKSFFTK